MSVGNIKKDTTACTSPDPFGTAGGREQRDVILSYLVCTAGSNVLQRFIGCGEDCYEQTLPQQSQDLSQDYLLISGGRFLMDENGQNLKKVKFSSLFCGNGLADDNRGVTVETPGPAVVR